MNYFVKFKENYKIPNVSILDIKKIDYINNELIIKIKFDNLISLGRFLKDNRTNKK